MPATDLLFFSKQFEDVWASRLWVSGVLVLEFGPILAWYRFPAWFFLMKLCTEMIVNYVIEYTTEWFDILLYFTQYVWKHILFLCVVSILYILSNLHINMFLGQHVMKKWSVILRITMWQNFIRISNISYWYAISFPIHLLSDKHAVCLGVLYRGHVNALFRNRKSYSELNGNYKKL